MNNNEKNDESQAQVLQQSKTSQKKSKENVVVPAEIQQILALVKSLVASDAQKSKEIADLKHSITELKSAHKDEQLKQSKAQSALVDTFKADLKSTVSDIAKSQAALIDTFKSDLKSIAADWAKASDEAQRSTVKLVNKKIEALTEEGSALSQVFSAIEENMESMNTSIVHLYENINTADLKSNVETLSEQVSDMLETSSDAYKIMSKFKDDAIKSLDKLASTSAHVEQKFLDKTEDLAALLEQVNKSAAGLGRTVENTLIRANKVISNAVDDAKNNINDLNQTLDQDLRETARTQNESMRINGVDVAKKIGVLINDSASSSKALKSSADKAEAAAFKLKASIERTEVLIKTVDIKKEEFDPLLSNGVKILKELTEVATSLSVSISDDQSGEAK